MKKIKALKCKECGQETLPVAKHVCEFCFGPLEVVYDYDAIRRELSREKIQSRPQNLWRYWELLPVESRDVISMNEGFTPFWKSRNLGKLLGLKTLYIKNDAVNPTLSFKDRVVTVALTRSRELGFDVVACASTGNLAGSVAAYGAVGGFKTFVFIPADLEMGKIVGAGVFDPIIVGIRGTYDEVNRLCAEVADVFKWAFVNVNIRPYYAEGSKTLGFEVAEQLGWRAPDHVVVPVASGSLLTKIYKGLWEFKHLGLIPEFHTRLSAAQAKGCAPVVTAIKEKSEIIKPVVPKTIAKSIAIGNPADGYYASQTVLKTGGAGEWAEDAEIVEGIRLLAKHEGVFTETAGGTTIAVLKKLVESGNIKPDEVVVATITGNGFKTQESVQDHISKPHVIPAKLKDFRELYDELVRSRKAEPVRA
ncbi:MAG: threonine synthase [Elusimicrobia bacterium RIFCSPHIGHO2_01_FULL_64_10]|nr:MAG: threonine synthase [Elusimicrobia bacterium RIFCSPHIGHO2_01_FULL_64_10]